MYGFVFDSNFFESTFKEICGSRIAEKVVRLKVDNIKDPSSSKHKCGFEKKLIAINITRRLNF